MASTITATIDLNAKPFIDSLNKATAETKELDATLEKVGKSNPFGGLTAQLDGLKSKFNEGREAASAGGGIFGDIAGQLGALASPAGIATAAIGGLVTGLKASFDLGKEFETNLQAVSAVTGVSGAALDDLGVRAKNLAGQFGGSASEQLGVFQTTLSKIGPQLAKDAGALSTFAENVNILSKTDSALGAAGAVDALTGAMLQFGVNVNDSNEVARESSRFINVLAASAAVGSASVSDVAGAVAVVGSTAKNANVSFEETNAALQVLASKSLTGSMAGTALTAVINKLQAAPGPAAEKLKELGTSSEKLGELLTTKGIGASIDELRGAMSKLGGTAEKNAFLVQLFGETGLNAAAALLGSGEMLADFTKGVTGTASATEQAQINMNTLGERLSRLKATFENVGISVFQFLAPIINQIFTIFGSIEEKLAPVFTKLFDTIGGVFSRIGNVLKPIFAGIGATFITSVVAQITAGATALSAIGGVLTNLFDKIASAIAPLADRIGKLFGFSDSAGKSIDVMKIFSNTLDIIVGSITSFGDIVSTVGGAIIEFLVTPFEIVIGIFTTVFDVVKNITNLFGETKKEVKGAGEEAKSGAGFFETLGNVFKNILGTISGVTAVFKEFKTIIGEAVQIVANFDLSNIGKSFEALKGLFSGAGKRFGEAYDKSFNDASGKKDPTTELYNKLKEFYEKKDTLSEADFAKEKNRLEESVINLQKANKITLTTAEDVSKKLKNIKQDELKLLANRLAEEQKLKNDAAAQTEVKEAKKEKEQKEKKVSDYIKELKDEADLKKQQLETMIAEEDALLAKQGKKREREGNILLSKKELDLAIENLEKFEKKFKITDDNGVITQKFTKERKDAVEILKEFEKLKQEVAKRTTAFYKLDITDVEKKALEIKKSLEDLKAETTEKKLTEYNITLGEEAFKAQVEKIRERIAKEKARLEELLQQKNAPPVQTDQGSAPQPSTLGTKIADFGGKKSEITSLDDVYAELLQREIEFNNIVTKVQSTAAQKRKDAELEAIEDVAEREIKAKIYSLEEQKKKALDNEYLIGAARQSVEKKYNKLIEEERAKLNKSSLDSITDTFLKAFSKFTLKITEEQKKAAEEAKKLIAQIKDEQADVLENIELEIDALTARAIAGKIEYNEYVNAVIALERKREKALEETNAAIAEQEEELAYNSEQLWELAKENIYYAFIDINKTLMDSFTQIGSDFGDLKKNIADDLDAVADKMEKALVLVASSIGASFGAMIAQGGKNLGDFLYTAAVTVIDAATAMLNAWAAVAIAKDTALLFGSLPATLAVIAGANVLLSVARSYLDNIGAEEGVVGIDGTYSKKRGKTDTIPIWVAAGETIINAESTRKHRTLLDAINNGGDVNAILADKYTPKEQQTIRQNIRTSVSVEHEFAPTKLRGNDIDIAVSRSRTRKLRRI